MSEQQAKYKVPGARGVGKTTIANDQLEKINLALLSNPFLISAAKAALKHFTATTEFSGDLFKDELEIANQLREAIKLAEPDWTEE